MIIFSHFLSQNDKILSKIVKNYQKMTKYYQINKINHIYKI